MSFFGPPRGKPSFFNDPMFAGLDLGGLDPSGVQGAIDANAAAPRQEKGGFGDSTLGKIIGILGDGALGFVGQPAAYGASIDEARQRQQKMMDEYERRQRERSERREDILWGYENKPKDPYIPDAEKQAKYYESIGDINTAKDIRDRVGLIPVQRLNPTTQDVETVMVRPGLLTDGGSTDANLPRISTPAEAAALPPGTPFIAPDGSRRRTPGGAAPSNGPGMFPRPY